MTNTVESSQEYVTLCFTHFLCGVELLHNATYGNVARQHNNTRIYELFFLCGLRTQQQRKHVFCALGPCGVVIREANSEACSAVQSRLE
jgi:hypothetical protein